MGDMIFVHELYTLVNSVIRFVPSKSTNNAPRVFAQQKGTKSPNVRGGGFVKMGAKGVALGWEVRSAARLHQDVQ
jgi:hypothetical protein